MFPVAVFPPSGYFCSTKRDVMQIPLTGNHLGRRCLLIKASWFSCIDGIWLSARMTVPRSGQDIFRRVGLRMLVVSLLFSCGVRLGLFDTSSASLTRPIALWRRLAADGRMRFHFFKLFQLNDESIFFASCAVFIHCESLLLCWLSLGTGSCIEVLE